MIDDNPYDGKQPSDNPYDDEEDTGIGPGGMLLGASLLGQGPLAGGMFQTMSGNPMLDALSMPSVNNNTENAAKPPEVETETQDTIKSGAYAANNSQRYTSNENKTSKKTTPLWKRVAVAVCVLVAGKLAYNHLAKPDYLVINEGVGQKVRVIEGGAVGFVLGEPSKQIKLKDGLVMKVVSKSINDKAYNKYGIEDGSVVIVADVGKNYWLLVTEASVEKAYPAAQLGTVDYFSPSVQKELLERQKIAQRKDTDDFNNSPQRQKAHKDRLERERKYIYRLNHLGKN